MISCSISQMAYTGTLIPLPISRNHILKFKKLNQFGQKKKPKKTIRSLLWHFLESLVQCNNLHYESAKGTGAEVR